jgi:predicted porin
MSIRFRQASVALLGCSLAAIAGTAQAQSSVKLYGLLDLNVGRFQSPGGEKVWNVSNGDMSTSFLGVSGKEDLGGGLSADFALESFFRPDTGRSGRVAIDAGTSTDVYWARAANVGLTSKTFGGIKFGRTTTTMFVSTLLFNPFGDSFGFSPSIRQYYTRELIGDSGWSNAAVYTSPSFGGLSVSLQGNLGEGTTRGTGRNMGGHLLYFGGPFAATVAYQQVKNTSDLRFGGNLPAGFDNQKAWQVGLSYNLGFAKLFGQYGLVDTEATVESEAKIAQLGASVPIGAGALLLSYGHDEREADTGDATYKIASLGYDYNLSKRTDVYAVYMAERLTGVSSGSTYAAGIRHKF